MNTPVIKTCRQDRNSIAWVKLCEYIDKLDEQKGEEFRPQKEIGTELFEKIYTLPESIARLKTIKVMHLYGSNLKRIPPEIGEMDALEYFTVYTSYNLKWLPYEINNCKNLKRITISKRVLYNNLKSGNGFPDLTNNPVRYSGDTLKCSICKKEITYAATKQFWTSQYIGGYIIPLLVNVCSTDCEHRIPDSVNGYVRRPHKGGKELELINKEMRRQISMPKSRRINPIE